MITLTNLSHALALRKYKNFRRAAAAENLSQPAFSRSIQKLEERLSVKLFERHYGAVTPTLYGESLLRRAENIFTETNEMEREIQILKGLQGGNFSLALGNYAAELSGSQAVGELICLHPNINVQVKISPWRNIADQVLSRSADLGIAEISIAKDIKQLQVEPLAEKELLLFCRQGHPLLKLEKVSKSDLDNYPLAMLRLPPRVAKHIPGRNNYQDEQSGDMIPSIEVDELATARAVVRSSDAFGISTAVQIEPWVRNGDLKILPFKAPWLKLDYGFITLKDRMISPITTVYMQLAIAIEKQQSKKNRELTQELFPGST